MGIRMHGIVHKRTVLSMMNLNAHAGQNRPPLLHKYMYIFWTKTGVEAHPISH